MDNDVHNYGPAKGEARIPLLPISYWENEQSGEPDEPMVGNIRAQLITDPDAHQTSFQHFSLTGENWIGTTCYPDGADIQGGGL